MTCLNSNTINVLTTIEGAHRGDDVVATSRQNTAVVHEGRLVDVRIGGLVLETSDGYLVFPHDDWSFTAAPPAPASFEADQVACPACASKPEDGTTAPSVEEIARVIYLHGLHVPEAPTTLPASCVAPGCTWASDLKGIDLRDAHNAHVAEIIRALYAGHALDSLLDARREKIAELEAEVARLTALAANKQSVIDEDRADAKRNRELQAATVADLRHAVALEVDRTNDANQRADELAARVQELEVEAARLEHALEKADVLIEALRHRYGTHVALGEAAEDDDRAARLIRDADEQNSAARRLLAELKETSALDRAEATSCEATADEKACSCGSRNAWAMTPGQRIVHRTDGPCSIEYVVAGEAKFANFKPGDLGPYIQATERAEAEAARYYLYRPVAGGEAAAEVRDAVESHAGSGEGEAAPR